MVTLQQNAITNGGSYYFFTSSFIMKTDNAKILIGLKRIQNLNDLPVITFYIYKVE